jgi:predicted DNA-binding transcriptional regulator YafY
MEGPVEAEEQAGGFERPPAPDGAPQPAWRLGDDEEVVARLLVDASQARWAVGALGEPAVAERRSDGSVVFDVIVTNRAGFRSFVLGFLDHAEVLGPPELRREMVDWLTQLAGAGARG